MTPSQFLGRLFDTMLQKLDVSCLARTIDGSRVVGCTIETTCQGQLLDSGFSPDLAKDLDSRYWLMMVDHLGPMHGI